MSAESVESRWLLMSNKLISRRIPHKHLFTGFREILYERFIHLYRLSSIHGRGLALRGGWLTAASSVSPDTAARQRHPEGVAWSHRSSRSRCCDWTTPINEGIAKRLSAGVTKFGNGCGRRFRHWVPAEFRFGQQGYVFLSESFGRSLSVVARWAWSRRRGCVGSHCAAFRGFLLLDLGPHLSLVPNSASCLLC